MKQLTQKMSSTAIAACLVVVTANLIKGNAGATLIETGVPFPGYIVTEKSNKAWCAKEDGLTEDSTFINSLMNNSKYDRRLRPHYGGVPLNLTVGLTVLSFEGVSEIESEFSLDVFFLQMWSDPRLSHTSTRTHRLAGQDKKLIWLPDSYFLNIKEASLHNVPSDNSRVEIQSDGNVTYSTRLMLTASCELELSTYPLDTQTCDLRIMSYANTVKEVAYFWAEKNKGGLSILNANMAQYDVISTGKIKRDTKVSHGGTYGELIARFKFKRRLGYSILEMYAPTILIVILSWFSFWISKDAIPARVSLGVTTVLTLVTLNGSLRSSVPKVSYVKALDWYLIVSFLFVFGAVLEYVAVLLYADYHGYAKFLCDEHDVTDHQTIHSDEDDDRSETMFSTQVQGLRNRTRNTSSDFEGLLASFRHKLWTLFSINSTPIDKASKILFPLAYFVFNVVYWAVY